MEADHRFLPYFDLPFQHASPRILRAMNRRGDRASYRDLIGRIRSRLPEGVIRTTFMTGFPGETEEDFRALLEFQEEARPDWMGCFTYSREEGTPAGRLPDRGARNRASRRRRILEERQVPISEARMDRFLGRNLEVLVEEVFPPEDSGGGALGRLFCQAPEVDGRTVIPRGEGLVPGSLVPCRVTGRRGFDLAACRTC
jgi:ribosomal protein S12 methylthiotransferase